jgi:hypothetical protein
MDAPIPTGLSLLLDSNKKKVVNVSIPSKAALYGCRTISDEKTTRGTQRTSTSNKSSPWKFHNELSWILHECCTSRGLNFKWKKRAPNNRTEHLTLLISLCICIKVGCAHTRVASSQRNERKSIKRWWCPPSKSGQLLAKEKCCDSSFNDPANILWGSRFGDDDRHLIIDRPRKVRGTNRPPLFPSPKKLYMKDTQLSVSLL